MASFKTILLTQKTDFLTLETEWNDLLARSNVQNIFLTWEWISTWYQHLHNTQKLWLITVRNLDTNQLMAIAPLMIQQRKIASFISLSELCFLASNAGSDHLDFIVDQQYIIDLSKELESFIHSQKKPWDLIHLEGSRNNAIAHRVFNSIEKNGNTYSTPCPYLNLPDSWTDYLKTLGKKRRYKINSYRRKLEANFPEKVQYQQVNTAEELNSCITELFSLHQQAQQAQGRKGIFSDPMRQNFHRQLCHTFLNNNWLRLYFLRVDGQAIAMLYSFFYQNRVSFYTTGFDLKWSAYSPGQQIIYYVLEQSINEKACVFDFLRGAEPYKFMMTKTINENQRFIAAQSILGKTAAWFFAQKKKLKNVS